MSDVRQDNEGYRRFREAMQSGTLRAGMVVTQNELCDLLGLSLSPLRETLVLLEEFGLVEIKPRTGIRIIYPEVAFIRENYQFRIMIEEFALRSFGDTVTEEWLANMRQSHEECRRNLTDGGPFEDQQIRFLALDNRMHREIVEALGNRAILDTHQRLQENIRMAQQVHRRPGFRGALLQTIEEHLKVIECLERRDVEGAVAALEAHFRASTHRTFAA
ncbi:MAG: GntR family transcriptional regulator [Devosia sp.]|uniref:GntR family transcriptional regulator n=1 Tax=Devosia sp. TaxID=1871048 RepID=UPI001AC290A1|nr:GntR family transcriptional regulator [Devosia sp.]MBN9309104.1 GntR family transcriptional regulator [Devosia sp.]MBN9317505.1 GntR family transcriptional regulator [Devosia sp.]